MPDLGVLLVEPRGPLGTEDIEFVEQTVDSWTEHHAQPLPGMVVHCHKLPGWQNIGALSRELRFIRDHRHKVRRLAIAADGQLAELTPRFADWFVDAEIKHFAYDDLDEALFWASATFPVSGGHPSAEPGAHRVKSN